MRRSLVLAALSILVFSGLNLWSLVLEPSTFNGWALFGLIALWAFLEFSHAGRHSLEYEAIIVWHRTVVAGIGLLLAVSQGARCAVLTGALESNAGMAAAKIDGVLLGLGLAVWGNYLPKVLSPWNREDEPFNWQSVHHFCGWLASFSGMALIWVWLAVPVERAARLSGLILLVFAALALGRKALSVATHSPGTTPTGGDGPMLIPPGAARRKGEG
jgi:hypothetical protein